MSLVITLVSGGSLCRSLFKCLKDSSFVFSETLHEVRGQLSKKNEMDEILKKNLIPGITGDKVSKIQVSGHFLGNRSLKVSNFLQDSIWQ